MMQDGETALHCAARSHQDGLEKLRFLVENGADVNIESETLFMVSLLWIVSGSIVRTCSEIFSVPMIAEKNGKVS